MVYERFKCPKCKKYSGSNCGDTLIVHCDRCRLVLLMKQVINDGFSRDELKTIVQAQAKDYGIKLTDG